MPVGLRAVGSGGLVLRSFKFLVLGLVGLRGSRIYRDFGVLGCLRAWGLWGLRCEGCKGLGLRFSRSEDINPPNTPCSNPL